ncbi:MAG: 3-oxoacyl-[acyl-carrier-protein] synthase III C-terminal domain-containing protein [Gammaproteobacteria bacterium]|jgi:3-hydroxy-3-methylglutaryl CoA synthase|nr:3-hydroxy-3-methylglutaryl CoA synthase [Gammaproteobacteria bacterium]MDP6096582.1 3-oxoacyl-[acyl-carrier-protein] synthase III C-terminal domain-containing protein [Gammaproteobacteria bacterium]MDP7455075.1 3-oxoacyl-[acyl-carrier-protein] synthase III C-terminal domain-containing protein [Gammaproteobacteria bacterium]HJO11597.1 3-oxoacyl-[acyl-carrier-protein] synthase III C-terminal domain-containing protein [Gammaproteobacteria bacterium]|tara:strand:+ start:85 stop:1521 length:1437 start_codon:yes stop_codon:yes gene_type:complete
MIGITAWGAYIPRARLSKQAMADANTWFDAGLKSLARGERSICNWDEDTITMAVEAGRDCLSALKDNTVASLYLASTTLPFLDRQNSVVVTEALNLDKHIRTMDISASQRAATSALISLLESNVQNNAMLVGSEHRRSKAGSRAEMLWGDAAAAVTVGSDDVVAEFLGAETRAEDFVDHYRGQDAEFDYDWEERWIRDEGFLKSVPAAVNALLDSAAISAGDITRFILPTDQARTPGAVAKKIGINVDAIVDNQITTCGVAGVAQPILLLAGVLEKSNPGDLILLVGFGQGCDALLFRATEQIENCKPLLGVAGALARRREEHNYNRFLSFNNLIERDIGKRSEADKQTFLSGYNRRKDLLTAFIGGRCRECGTVQIPKEKYCVNPECNALESQDDAIFSDKTGTVKTWTADRLTFDWSPPAYFGMVEFDGGGKLMMDFTEVEEGSIDSGSKVSMHFRIKQFDSQRGFRKYFWKASPL